MGAGALVARAEAAFRATDARARSQADAALRAADRELTERLHAVADPLRGPLSAEVAAAILAQARATVRDVLVPRLVEAAVATDARASVVAAGSIVEYVERADGEARPGELLDLDDERIVESALAGVCAAERERLPVVFDRYAESTLAHVESIVRFAQLARMTLDAARGHLVERAPLLRGDPADWARLVLRNEGVAAYNRAAWEATREVDAQLGDVHKILLVSDATLDGHAVRGQVRRPDEAFETRLGYLQYPPVFDPARDAIAPHRLAWPIPPDLRPASDRDVEERRRLEGADVVRARPPISTVDVRRFGRG